MSMINFMNYFLSTAAEGFVPSHAPLKFKEGHLSSCGGATVGSRITDKMEERPQLPLFVPQAWTQDEGVRPYDSDLFFPLLG